MTTNNFFSTPDWFPSELPQIPTAPGLKPGAGNQANGVFWLAAILTLLYVIYQIKDSLTLQDGAVVLEGSGEGTEGAKKPDWHLCYSCQNGNLTPPIDMSKDTGGTGKITLSRMMGKVHQTISADCVHDKDESQLTVSLNGHSYQVKLPEHTTNTQLSSRTCLGWLANQAAALACDPYEPTTVAAISSSLA